MKTKSEDVITWARFVAGIEKLTFLIDIFLTEKIYQWDKLITSILLAWRIQIIKF